MPAKKSQNKSNIKVDKHIAEKRVKKILPILKKTYPEAKTALKFNSTLELLIATVLSAQCTDVRVNIVTQDLFKKYRTAADWADKEISEIEQDIKSTGFYRNKAKNIKAACNRIVQDYSGKVPDNLAEMVKLPGVGRKTANVVLGNAFGKPAVACDTHVIRLSRRLGLSENKDAVKLEFDLMEIVPRSEWTRFSHLLIFHGRSICKSRRPDCAGCVVAGHCPSANRPKLW